MVFVEVTQFSSLSLDLTLKVVNVFKHCPLSGKLSSESQGNKRKPCLLTERNKQLFTPIQGRQIYCGILSQLSQCSAQSQLITFAQHFAERLTGRLAERLAGRLAGHFAQRFAHHFAQRFV
jgi:hypothetical protein